MAADVLSYGLGGVGLQLQPDNSWQPVSIVLRAMIPTETRYVQIEREALALTWAYHVSDHGSTLWESQSLLKRIINPTYHY